jgi:hypothetical protein
MLRNSPAVVGSAFSAPEQSALTQSIGVSRRRRASTEEDFLLVKRYILTGAPGAGKTSILRSLAERGWAVVEEAATDVIAREQLAGVSEPWQRSDFADKIVRCSARENSNPSRTVSGCSSMTGHRCALSRWCGTWGARS